MDDQIIKKLSKLLSQIKGLETADPQLFYALIVSFRNRQERDQWLSLTSAPPKDR